MTVIQRQLEALGYFPHGDAPKKPMVVQPWEKVVTAEQVPDMLELFAKIADGESWEDVGFGVINKSRCRYQKFL